jgi:hypothetical protein
MEENDNALSALAALVNRAVDLIPAAQALVVAICFILGMTLTVIAVRGFAITSERATSGQGRALQDPGLIGPMVTLLVAVLMMSLSETISAFLVSFFQTPRAIASSEIFSYAPEMLKPLDHEQARTVVIGLLRFVQFIGLIGFVRGLFLLNKSVHHTHAGLVAAGTTHLIGGVLAMNIVQFLGMIEKLVIG